MKKNSYNRAMIAGLMTAIISLGALLWPTTGHSQSSSRRDRYRRDRETSSRSEPSKTDRRQASEQKAVVIKPVEPNAGAKSTVPTAQPKAAGEATVPRPDGIAAPMESLADEESGPLARYGIILQRNIFSRQRTPFRPRDRSEPQVVVAPNPETHFVLKGVVQEDSQFIAFIEDTQGGGVLRLRQGAKVARGAIKTLSLDALEYQLEDKTISVKLGCDLEGTRVPVTVTVTVDEVPIVSQTPAPASTGTPASTTAPQPKPGQPTPAPTGGDEADILKRLMEQRRQQLGQ